MDEHKRIGKLSDEDLDAEERAAASRREELRASEMVIFRERSELDYRLGAIAEEKKNRLQKRGGLVTELTGLHIRAIVQHDRHKFGLRREDLEKWLLSRPGVRKVDLSLDCDMWDGDDPFVEE